MMPDIDDDVAAPAIEVANVSKAFGGVSAVNELSFSVGPGDAVGVIGPNGAGKSTLLKLMSGSLRPDRGSIQSNGHLISGRPTHQVARSGIVMAHQTPRPFRSLSVHDNVVVAQRRHGLERRGQAEAILELCGLQGKRQALASDLGLLDLKRLEVARALSTDPTVILLDEVAAGLNGRDLDEAIELVDQIHRSGTTIIVVEHIERVIRDLVDRVLVLNWGRIIADGTPAEISAHPEVREVYLGIAGSRAARPRSESSRPGPVVSMRGGTARYGDVQALSDISVDIGPGEVVGVLGANGAGKSTLASAISGHVALASGSVHAFGRDITRMQPHLRARAGIAHCPEGRHVFSDLTVQENLDVSVPLRTKTSVAALRYEAVYSLFSILQDRRRQPAGTLSGGEQQMLSIGRALMTDPKLLICDELSLGLAPKTTDTIYAALKRIAARGVMLIVIEQDVSRCLEIADWVYVLLRGQQSYSGPPSALSDESFLDRVYFGRETHT